MHVIFDLDGTLVDSRPAILRGLRWAAQQHYPDDVVARLQFEIGPPVREMFRRALGHADEAELDLLEQAFRIYYDSEGWMATAAYPGVHKVLGDLIGSNHRAYVVTNKPRLAATKILDLLGLRCYFVDVVSPDSRNPAFQGKTEMLLHLLAEHRILVADACYIGDTEDDWHAAELSSVRFIGVAYGYGTFPTEQGSPRTAPSFADILTQISFASSPATADRRIP